MAEIRLSRIIKQYNIGLQDLVDFLNKQGAGIEEALLYCTALVSLKMETPGPFQGTRQDVLDYIREFY